MRMIGVIAFLGISQRFKVLILYWYSINNYVSTTLLLYLGCTLSYGTGSYPLPPQGLHLSIRHIARASPL